MGNERTPGKPTTHHDPGRVKIIVGVDTHKYAHVAVAIDELGTRLGECHVRANREGYAQPEAWAASLGCRPGQSVRCRRHRQLRRRPRQLPAPQRTPSCRGNRGDRRSRRTNGKTDTFDAEAAARSVLSGESAAVPKSADGTVEMIRQIKTARDTARKGRTHRHSHGRDRHDTSRPARAARGLSHKACHRSLRRLPRG